MKKSILKLLIVITITSLILLFFAGCKSPDTTEFEERIEALEKELSEKEVEEASPGEEEETPPVILTDTKQLDEELAEEEEASEEEAQEEEDPDADKEAPTISLAIYEGPTLDGSICYYRIEATVTGSPNPSVIFNKDDSGGAWGSKKAQINLNDPSDTYTLTVTATNSEGSATDTIALSWGCAIPEPDPIEEDVDISADIGLSGHIIVDTGAYPGNDLAAVGEDSNNKLIKTYLSFDIGDLGDIDDIAIKDVSVFIPINEIVNHPEIAGSEILIKVYDYGNSLELADQVVGGVLVRTISTANPLANFKASGNKLKDELQKAVDIDKKWFQLKIVLNGVWTNNTPDYYRLFTSNAILHIEYEIPG